MSSDDRPGTSADSSVRQRDAAGNDEASFDDYRPRHRPIELRAAVVAYPDAPDRCTIYPPETTGVARMSTWLTADSDAVVDLAAVR